MKTLLFFDDWLLERRDCLERVWHQPQFVKQLFNNLHPGVLGYGGYITAFYDDRLAKYVMYLAVYPPEADPGTFVVRLQSDDPAQWPEPVYDVSVTPAWRGFQDVVVDQEGLRFWPYAVQALAGTPRADRGYMTTEWHRARRVSTMGFSRDGLHFTMDRAGAWQDPGCDNPGNLLWSEHTGSYVLFTRQVATDRRIALSTSTDLERFTPLITALQPDALDQTGTEFYDMPAFRYADFYLGLLHIFSTDPYETQRVKFAGRMETQLAHSYNGIHWYRPVREAFIGLRDYGLQGGGQVYAMAMLTSPDNKLLFFVHASKGEHHAYPDMQAAGMDTRGYFNTLLYEMRLDGFCSLKTWARDGVLETRTLMPQSGQLRLNLRTTAHTAVRVQVLDGATGEPIPGYTWEEAVPITGDHLFAEPHWQERRDLSELVGRPVRLALKMREAELFAMRLDCQAHFSLGPPLDSLA